MARRIGQAQWEGTLKDGKGRFWTESGEVSGVYSFGTRFEDREGSNPEELIGAALASCYSMQFAADLERVGQAPESVRTIASVRLEKREDGFEITGIDLDVETRASAIDPEEFERIAQAAKEHCPVGKALAAIPVSLRARRAA